LRITFDGRVALVAGGSGGMGRRIALDLHEAGASVVAADIASDFADPPTGRFAYVAADLSTQDGVARAVDAVVESFGRLDVVANTVGVLWFDRDTAMGDIDEPVWDRVLAINIKPMMWLARHAVPAMIKSGDGAMVHVSSTDALGGDDAPQDAYGASKAAMLRMSKSLAVQYAGRGVRSNVILPGSVLTPMQARWRDQPEKLGEIEAAVPLGRVGRPEDISNAALFLLSDKANYITGAELIVDGGWCAYA